ncbi:DUF4365 domain-containing protein [Streptomyces xanthophaeus]|uniref:DUF4365 domain-containing protein n=1 Tax=Streptomyces xanthophaeus TaxID=67385 RepID=UPI0038638F33|nr:DUF4365 domain-containing protein [Streptomyces xanthophaeus]WST61293.1 DUF4365 domain-containing protein [Streptomyces xanthophaeus]
MPNVHSTHLIDRAGVSRAAYLVSTQLGWLFREQETSDIGVDAHLEVVDTAGLAPGSVGLGTGRLLAVQLKSGASQFASPGEGGWWYYCDTRHVVYWHKHSLPVVIMLFNPATEQVFWQHVDGETLKPTGQNYKIFVPEAQQLDEICAEALSRPARHRTKSSDSPTDPDRPEEARKKSVRLADYELAGSIDLLMGSTEEGLAGASPRDFRTALANRLRSLRRLAGSPSVELISARTGYEEDKIAAYLAGSALPGRSRTVTIVDILIEHARVRGVEVPGHFQDIRAWERMQRVAKRPGMQKIVKNKALAGSLKTN